MHKPIHQSTSLKLGRERLYLHFENKIEEQDLYHFCFGTPRTFYFVKLYERSSFIVDKFDKEEALILRWVLPPTKEILICQEKLRTFNCAWRLKKIPDAKMIANITQRDGDTAQVRVKSQTTWEVNSSRWWLQWTLGTKFKIAQLKRKHDTVVVDHSWRNLCQ